MKRNKNEKIQTNGSHEEKYRGKMRRTKNK